MLIVKFYIGPYNLIPYNVVVPVFFSMPSFPFSNPPVKAMRLGGDSCPGVEASHNQMSREEAQQVVSHS